MGLISMEERTQLAGGRMKLRSRVGFGTTLSVVFPVDPSGSHYAAADLAAAPTCTDDAAFWLYSSGSTGAPKACIHLQHDMVVATEQYARNILNIRESDRFFSVAKLFFAYGLGNGMYFPLSVGARTVLNPERTKVDRVLELVNRRRPTVFFAVPTFYAAILREAEKENCGVDFSSVRQCVSAGEAFRRKYLSAGKNDSAWKFSMESDPRKCCTCLFPAVQENANREAAVFRFRISKPRLWMTRANPFPTVESEISGCAAKAPSRNIGVFRN